ncbi:F0F1 ATP synthase subunit A [Svornostia abyssi]|uniref:ATP synthase subunit a n=1 Tax=Svornostia abyssi TaxID=2898438 RepID=A0ABY5PNA4_9ACTN|nr:F0F1 ATP synthase subunit A [Parviterribacteraceae bacterium J379]
MTTRLKVFTSFFVLFGLTLILFAITGSAGKNEEFAPVDEFRLEAWIPINEGGAVDLSITKAVMYLIIAGILTVGTMLFIANRMEARPNRTQTAVESLFTLMRDNITRGNMDDQMARKWFPFIGAIFLFIWYSNLIGYIPLPTSTAHTVEVFGVEMPTFALYAATANISVPLVLTLVVWFAYHIQGVKAKGLIPYVKGWVPAGSPGPLVIPIFFIEVISHFVRIISLSVRLFANILAGHLLILFMGGGLAVLLGVAALGVITAPVAVAFFLFEVGLVATLQAFIFATLTAIYLGGAVAEDH